MHVTLDYLMQLDPAARREILRQITLILIDESWEEPAETQSEDYYYTDQQSTL